MVIINSKELNLVSVANEIISSNFPRTFIACLGIFSVIPILIGYMIVNIDTLNLVQITEPIVTLRKYLNNLHKAKNL